MTAADRINRAMLTGLLEGERKLGSRPEVEAARRALDEALAMIDAELAAVARLREIAGEREAA